MDNNLLNLLGRDAYWVLNKKLVKHLGCDTTLLLQHFIDLQFKLFDGKEFYQQQERITEETSLGEHTIRECVKKLNKFGILNIVKKGLPAKNYYNINQDIVMDILNGVSHQEPMGGHQVTHSGQENGQLVVTEPDNQWSENLTTSGHNFRPQRKELIKKELIEKTIDKKELREEKEKRKTRVSSLSSIEEIIEWCNDNNRELNNSPIGIIKYHTNYLSLSFNEKQNVLKQYSKEIK
jgi:hypothetical protein